jgi:hypothetical protein
MATQYSSLIKPSSSILQLEFWGDMGDLPFRLISSEGSTILYNSHAAIIVPLTRYQHVRLPKTTSKNIGDTLIIINSTGMMKEIHSLAFEKEFEEHPGVVHIYSGTYGDIDIHLTCSGINRWKY